MRIAQPDRVGRITPQGRKNSEWVRTRFVLSFDDQVVSHLPSPKKEVPFAMDGLELAMLNKSVTLRAQHGRPRADEQLGRACPKLAVSDRTSVMRRMSWQPPPSPRLADVHVLFLTEHNQFVRWTHISTARLAIERPGVSPFDWNPLSPPPSSRRAR
jgi:hypothetical protein